MFTTNNDVLQDLFARGAIRIRRGVMFDSVPAGHSDVPWDRIQGMMLGLAIGDSLGNCSESMMPLERRIVHGELIDFMPNFYADGRPVGLPSDDTQLAAWTLEQLIEDGKKVWPLVGAHFPLFRDGRSFSTAALLRDRFQWTGEIRAIGDVLIDQLLQGARVGFDSFALRPDQKTEVALKQFDLFSVTTQNTWRDKRATLAL